MLNKITKKIPPKKLRNFLEAKPFPPTHHYHPQVEAPVVQASGVLIGFLLIEIKRDLKFLNEATSLNKDSAVDKLSIFCLNKFRFRQHW